MGDKYLAADLAFERYQEAHPVRSRFFGRRIRALSGYAVRNAPHYPSSAELGRVVEDHARNKYGSIWMMLFSAAVQAIVKIVIELWLNRENEPISGDWDE